MRPEDTQMASGRPTSELVLIDYTNWRGERRKRTIYPLSIRLGSTKWHPEVQWLLSAMDVEDDKQKDFAMKDIHSWEAV